MGQGQSNAPISTVSNTPQDDGLTWYCKIGAKSVCVIGGLGKFFISLSLSLCHKPCVAHLFTVVCGSVADSETERDTS